MKTARKKLRKNYAKTIAKGFKIHTYQRWSKKEQKQIKYLSKKDIFFIKDDYSSKRTIKDSQRRLYKKLGSKRLRKIQNLYPHHPNIYGLFKLVPWGLLRKKENNFSLNADKLDEILAMFDSGRVDLSKLGLGSWKDREVIKDIEYKDEQFIPKNIYELYVLHTNGAIYRVDTSKICNTIEYKDNKYYPSNNYEVMSLCLNESINLKDIDISNTTSLECAFLNSKRSDFGGINEWDTSRIKSMRSMFSGCGNFNEKLSFDTSSVEDFSYMFSDCGNFNQEVNFNTQNAKDFEGMFDGCTKFNQKINFDFSNVIATCNMFKDCVSFNQEINASNSKELLRTCSMFSGCKSFDSKVMLDTHKVHNMAEMFRNCVKFNQRLDFNTCSLENIREMFRDCISFNQEFIVKNDCLYNVKNTFNGCINLAKNIHFVRTLDCEEKDISLKDYVNLSLITPKVLEYEDTFKGCEKLKNISIQTNEIKAN
ncbi:MULTISPECIES: BspA family leucine-rich repeat surface protein [unclassified Campylobacter]|uniref:BspA family leucine-rich repeat surface protein n=1 Tax=unclassified Campylobacter TaxID=2593542 RepID=UPI001BDB488E|nr:MULTISPECIES: BspA family leucine-rich repeat surface protein [unclassified Campylobacter]MBT0879773.1 BspA family leucine-rich repeat surface protein [Campylobacter sp. 2018MI27]MBT0885117.1 BspA family leucine-rich repeat surface protein [Campylobacter sp. 2018MI10]